MLNSNNIGVGAIVVNADESDLLMLGSLHSSINERAASINDYSGAVLRPDPELNRFN